jgi:hypothetical protein
VPTSLHVLDFLNERGKKYQAEVLKCAGRLSSSEDQEDLEAIEARNADPVVTQEVLLESLKEQGNT